MRLRAMLPVILSVAVLAQAQAADAREPVRRSATTLLTVDSDAPASCRIVDARGASRTREFGTPATIALPARHPGDQVVCVRDGREKRAAVPATGTRVGVAMGGATTTASPVRRLVTLADVHPDAGRMRLTPQAEQDLVWLRQRYEEGAITERDYFAHRREVITRGAVLAPTSGGRGAATTPRRLAPRAAAAG